ncbi:MAG: hypothetical protein HC861_09105 [Rhodospirillaceae bacterium]|nr:hypothetical protein [Rhodospirillaceae bacterium]
MVFDGRSVWICSGSLRRFDTQNLMEDASYPISAAAVGRLVLDGEELWILGSLPRTLVNLDPATASVLLEVVVAGGGGGSSSFAYDGSHLWVGNQDSNTVDKRGLDGSLVETYAVHSAPTELLFDGAHVWVACRDGTIVKLKARDGSELGSFQVGFRPGAMAFDGINVWVASEQPSVDGTYALRKL